MKKSPQRHKQRRRLRDQRFYTFMFPRWRYPPMSDFNGVFVVTGSEPRTVTIEDVIPKSKENTAT